MRRKLEFNGTTFSIPALPFESDELIRIALYYASIHFPNQRLFDGLNFDDCGIAEEAGSKRLCIFLNGVKNRSRYTILVYLHQENLVISFDSIHLE